MYLKKDLIVYMFDNAEIMFPEVKETIRVLYGSPDSAVGPFSFVTWLVYMSKKNSWGDVNMLKGFCSKFAARLSLLNSFTLRVDDFRHERGLAGAEVAIMYNENPDEGHFTGMIKTTRECNLAKQLKRSPGFDFILDMGERINRQDKNWRAALGEEHKGKFVTVLRADLEELKGSREFLMDLGVRLEKKGWKRIAGSSSVAVRDKPWSPDSDVDMPKEGEKECKKCNITYDRESTLVKHLLKFHKVEFKYYCDVKSCGKGYSSNEGLKMHKLTHTSERIYCRFSKAKDAKKRCKIEFTSAKAERKHFNDFHNPDRNDVKCEMEKCQKMFRTKANMRQHLAICPYNPKKQWFTCSKCPAKFRRKPQLYAHVRDTHK